VQIIARKNLKDLAGKFRKINHNIASIKLLTK
jgi:hypothetical protein